MTTADLTATADSTSPHGCLLNVGISIDALILRLAAIWDYAPLGVQMPVIEKILNHVSGSFGGIAGVYQRREFAAEMYEALARWVQHVEGLVSDKPVNSSICGGVDAR
jgi:hypothetical protein